MITSRDGSQRLLDQRSRPMRTWMLSDLAEQRAGHEEPGPRHPGDTHRPAAWWKVMCLTGVDYFSTLGYQPGIAALAAGVLSPIATLVLVAVTLLGALPVYRRVAGDSPHGEGSIAMLERLLSFWKGKLLVLVLLGFAATDFMITMTLSAADATAHLDENPLWPQAWRNHAVTVTLILLALLAAVFLKGFKEAISLAVGLVGVYLALNLVVVTYGLWLVATHPGLLANWATTVTTQRGDPIMMIALALLLFPKLALGLSGFETGVAVMPHVRGDRTDTERDPRGRIRNTRRLLNTAALIMSVFLLASSLITTVLIPAPEFQPGGAANGRALAYLAHEHLGTAFGTGYDLSTIAILWFAGASAMAGLLNLVPRYLPRYGMAPVWARAVRPLVIVFALLAFAITIAFHADVNAQGGAYATGVLVLITSAAVAVTLAVVRDRKPGKVLAFGMITAIFVYTTVANVIERPDGVKIGGCFTLAIIVVSIASRLRRAFELRATQIQLDAGAKLFVRDCATRRIRLIANEPDNCDEQKYYRKIRQISIDNDLPSAGDVIFAEVVVTDPSDFEADLRVTGRVRYGRYRVLTMEASSIPNALAALLLHVRDVTGRRPHIYFEWTEGNPALNFLRYLVFGQGEVAPVTREVIRQREPDRACRPHVHVG